MTQSTTYWLATLMVAVIITGTSLRTSAAETGPEKAPITPTEKVTPDRGGGAVPGTKRETYPFRGRVASFDIGAQALKLEGKTTQRVVHLTPQTRLTKQGQPAMLDDLKAGEEVGGTLRKGSEGREEALLIRIGPKSDSPTPNAGANRPPAKSGTSE